MFGQQLDQYNDGTGFVSLIYATDKNLFEVGAAHPLYNDNLIIIVYCGENKAMAQSIFNQHRDNFQSGNLPQYIQEQDAGLLAALAGYNNRKHYKSKINGGLG